MKQLEACKIQIEVEKRHVISKAWDLKYPSVQSFLTEPKDQFLTPTENGKWELSWELGTAKLEINMCLLSLLWHWKIGATGFLHTYKQQEKFMQDPSDEMTLE